MSDDAAKDAVASKDTAAPDSDATVVTRDDTRTRTSDPAVSRPGQPTPRVSDSGEPRPPEAAGGTSAGGSGAEAAPHKEDDATRLTVAPRVPGGPPVQPPPPPRPPSTSPPSTAAPTSYSAPKPPPAMPRPPAAPDDTSTRTVEAGPAPPPRAPASAAASPGTAPGAAGRPGASPGDASTLSRTVDIADDATVVRVAPRGRPRVILTDAGGGKREVLLTAPDVSIGRAKTCDVILSNAEVSRLHARIVARGADHVLVPVGTRRNTYVNGELALDERLLRHGDVVQLASDQLIYAEDEHVPSAAGVAVGPAPRTGTPLALAAALAVVAAAVVVWMLWTPRAAETPVPPPASAAAPVVANPAPAPAPPPAPPVEVAAPANDAPRADAAPVIDPRAAQVSKLVYEGDIAFVEKKYTTPTEGSALFAYQQALKLDPQNARARSQIALIIDRYLDLAERALAANDRADARLYADKAAYVHEQVADVGDRDTIERRLDGVSKRLGAPTRR